jgi:hypothetical protein
MPVKRLVVALCLCAPALLAQQEPTPFWMPPPPPQKTAPAKQKPALPAKKRPAPGSEAAPASAKKKKREPVQKRVDVEPQEEPAPPPVKKRRREGPAVREPAAQAPALREPAVRAPVAPREPRPGEELRPEPEPKASRTRRPVTPVAPTPSEEPAASEPPPARPSQPVPEGSAPMVGETPGALVAETPPVEPVPDEPRGPSPRFSVGLELGLWGSPAADSSSRLYDAAYGLRVGFELLPERLELELLALRASRTAGSGFANASTAHDLLAARAFYLLGSGRFAALLGGGAGVVLAQTHYSVQDVGGTPVGLDATSGKLVLQLTAGGRARVYRGLDVRAEVSALVRDGQLNLLPLLSAGWAF